MLRWIGMTVVGGLAVALSGCAAFPQKPMRFEVPYDAPKSEIATVWADNTDSEKMTVAFDGMKLTPGGGFKVVPEYAASAPPGERMLKVHYTAFEFPGYEYSDAKFPVSLEAGHDYALRFTRIRDEHVTFYIVDLGTDVVCRYEKSDSMHQGYTPVELICDKR